MLSILTIPRFGRLVKSYGLIEVLGTTSKILAYEKVLQEKQINIHSKMENI